MMDFRGQVVLVHRDSHYFKIDKPINLPSGGMLANFTCVETFGARQGAPRSTPTTPTCSSSSRASSRSTPYGTSARGATSVPRRRTRRLAARRAGHSRRASPAAVTDGLTAGVTIGDLEAIRSGGAWRRPARRPAGPARPGRPPRPPTGRCWLPPVSARPRWPAGRRRRRG